MTVLAGNIFLLAGAALFALGLGCVFGASEPIRRIIAINIAGSGVFMIFVATAARPGGGPDPVPHAMVLTGIVVAVCATALALVLANLCRSKEEASREEDVP
jgi:multicomponent Na+:H+ antiporter subunit C